MTGWQGMQRAAALLCATLTGSRCLSAIMPVSSMLLISNK